MTGQDVQVTGCTRDQAQAITGRFRESIGRVESAWNVMVANAIDAFTNRVWEPLGYASWDSYCAEEVGAAAARIPRDLRIEIVGQMSAAGMSNRAIAPAIGVTHPTVSSDRRSGGKDLPPDRAPVVVDFEPALTQAECEELDRLDTVVIDAAEPARITGVDGKSYPRPSPAALGKPRRLPCRRRSGEPPWT